MIRKKYQKLKKSQDKKCGKINRIKVYKGVYKKFVDALTIPDGIEA